MESVRLGQALLLILLLLLPVQHRDDDRVEHANAGQSRHGHQYQFTGSYEQLSFPPVRVARRPRYDNHLRVRDDLRPTPRVIGQADRQVVDEVRSPAQAEDRVGQIQAEMRRLRQLSGCGAARIPFLSGRQIRDSGAR